jgi:hypothetical protein
MTEVYVSWCDDIGIFLNAAARGLFDAIRVDSCKGLANIYVGGNYSQAQFSAIMSNEAQTNVIYFDGAPDAPAVLSGFSSYADGTNGIVLGKATDWIKAVGKSFLYTPNETSLTGAAKLEDLDGPLSDDYPSGVGAWNNPGTSKQASRSDHSHAASAGKLFLQNKPYADVADIPNPQVGDTFIYTNSGDLMVRSATGWDWVLTFAINP